MSVDPKRLADFFPAEDVEWKPVTVSRKTNKALAAAYITNRAIMDRLDAVCGPENWRNEYAAGPDGGVLCGLSVRVGDEWVTKWDGAENSDIEPVKGGLSNAMRRAAVQWGIGRYLYDLPSQWVPVDERGRFIQPPRIEPKFLPPRSGAPEPVRQAPKANGKAPAAGKTGKGANQPASGAEPITQKQLEFVDKLLCSHVWTEQEVAATWEKAQHLTKEAATGYIDKLKAELAERKGSERSEVVDEATGEVLELEAEEVPFDGEDWEQGSMFEGDAER